MKVVEGNIKEKRREINVDNMVYTEMKYEIKCKGGEQ
jgi:hypothetical protein